MVSSIKTGEGSIPSPDHKSVSSERDSELGLDKLQLNEAAVAPAQKRSTLPYYRPPSRTRTGLELSVNEMMLPEAATELAPPEVVRDVATASFGETNVLEAIIGNDDRVRVADGLMRANPWRQICALRIRSKTGKMYVGTGWFIAPNVLATAGHCVFLQNEGGWAQSIDVFPAKAGSVYFGKATSRRFRAVDGWVRNQSRDFDYGVILLDDGEMGARVGNFAVRVLDDAALKAVDAKISGYPADRDRAEYQYFHERPLQSTTNTRLNYDIDTFGGQSGSPIWVDTEDGVLAVGVHTTGGISSNSGTRINMDVLGNLIGWIRSSRNGEGRS